MFANFSGLTLVTPPVCDPVTIADMRGHSRIFQAAEDSLLGGYIASATLTAEEQTKRALMPQTWKYTLNCFPGRRPGIGYREGTYEEYWRNNSIEIPKPPLISVEEFAYISCDGVKHLMTQGVGNIVGNYLLDLEPEPGRLTLPFAGIWPTEILLPASPVQITYNCGYAGASLAGYVGAADIDANGLVTWTAGDKFGPGLRGTWMTFATGNPGEYGSYTVAKAIDEERLQLTVPDPSPLLLPVSDVSFSGNTVPMPIRHAILHLAGHAYQLREIVVEGHNLAEIPKTADMLLAPYRIFKTG